MEYYLEYIQLKQDKIQFSSRHFQHIKTMSAPYYIYKVCEKGDYEHIQLLFKYFYPEIQENHLLYLSVIPSFMNVDYYAMLLLPFSCSTVGSIAHSNEQNNNHVHIDDKNSLIDERPCVFSHRDYLKIEDVYIHKVTKSFFNNYPKIKNDSIRIKSLFFLQQKTYNLFSPYLSKFKYYQTLQI